MSWTREPLVHFVAVGLVVFGIQIAMSGGLPEEVEEHSVIVVDRAVEVDVERQLTEALGRVPEPDELSAAMERWVHTEVLVREARRLELDSSDAIVRRRLAEKMVYVAQSSAVPPEPPEGELRALYDQVKGDFLLDTKITLRHVFAKGPDARQRASELRDRWVDGEDPVELTEEGDPPPGGPVLRNRTPERLAEIYGEGFGSVVADLDDTPTLVESELGWHVVQIDRVREGRQLTFEEARDRLALRWRATWIEQATAKTVESLIDQYEVEGWP